MSKRNIDFKYLYFSLYKLNKRGEICMEVNFELIMDGIVQTVQLTYYVLSVYVMVRGIMATKK